MFSILHSVDAFCFPTAKKLINNKCKNRETTNIHSSTLYKSNGVEIYVLLKSRYKKLPT